MIKLIALDIDGTLINSHNQILPSTKEVVEDALKRGIKVVLCSGRPLSGLKPLLNELAIQGEEQFAVTLNGAVVRNADNKIIAQDLIDNASYREMVAFAKKNQIPFNVVDADSQIITADRNINLTEAYQSWKNHVEIWVREPDEMSTDFVIAKGCFVGDSAMLDKAEPKVRAKFGNRFSIIRSDPYFLEVMQPGVDKGFGLRQLGKKIGIKPSEMMAFGDAGNDVSMFKVVGTAIAMGNGLEIAKNAADFVTSSNDEDGIAKAYRKFIQ